jgi:hypothetical protein
LAVLAGINQQLINYLNENISHLENNVKKCWQVKRLDLYLKT